MRRVFLIRRRPRIPRLAVRHSRQRRQQRLVHLVADNHGLIPDQAANREAKTARPGPSADLKSWLAASLRISRQGDGFVAVPPQNPTRFAQPRRELRGIFDSARQPPEMAPGGVLQMGGMNDQLLFEDEQARELPRLEQRTLPVLPANHEPDLTGRPLPIRRFPKAMTQNPLLPLIQMQPSHRSELDCFIPRRRRVFRNVAYARPLSPQQDASLDGPGGHPPYPLLSLPARAPAAGP